jgi:hypothetical protein
MRAAIARYGMVFSQKHFIELKPFVPTLMVAMVRDTDWSRPRVSESHSVKNPVTLMLVAAQHTFTFASSLGIAQTRSACVAWEIRYEVALPTIKHKDITQAKLTGGGVCVFGMLKCTVFHLTASIQLRSTQSFTSMLKTFP